MVTDGFDEEGSRTLGFAMRQKQKLPLDFLYWRGRHELSNSSLTDSQPHEFKRDLIELLLVHTGLVLRNAWTFSATSSIPPKKA